MTDALLPEIGQIVAVRQRLYLVDRVIPPPNPSDSLLIQLSCVDDDAQGQPLFEPGPRAPGRSGVSFPPLSAAFPLGSIERNVLERVRIQSRRNSDVYELTKNRACARWRSKKRREGASW